MIEVHPEPLPFDNSLTMSDRFRHANANSTKEKIQVLIDTVKTMPIEGCITGSCFLPTFDPDGWDTEPDVDVFVYNEVQLARAITLAQYVLGMNPGKGTERSQRQEQWKIDRFFNDGQNRRIHITTETFYCEGVMLNFTYKETKVRDKWVPCFSVESVLKSFDMSIVMQGYDIKTHTFHDLRAGDPMIATPNPMRRHDCMSWTVRKWIRQFDRVIKYYNRGFDTRPLAQFYLDMIDECINMGNLFDSEESQAAFEEFSEEFREKRNDIEAWLNEHKED